MSIISMNKLWGALSFLPILGIGVWGAKSGTGVNEPFFIPIGLSYFIVILLVVLVVINLKKRYN